MRTITVVAMVTAVMPVRAEIDRIGGAGGLLLRWRRCRDRTGDDECTCDKGCRDQALHDGLPLRMIQMARNNLAEFTASRKTKTGPQ